MTAPEPSKDEQLSKLKRENLVLKEQIGRVNSELQNVLKELQGITEENGTLHGELEKLKQQKSVKEASSQTEPAASNDPSSTKDDQESDNNTQEVLTAESIAATARSALANSGWVYDQSTGTYFDYNTNLYYYPRTRLYYSYRNGCYYKYNQETQKYEFHYQHESFRQQTIEKTENHDASIQNTTGANNGPKKYLPCVEKVKNVTYRMTSLKENRGAEARNLSEGGAPSSKRRKLDDNLANKGSTHNGRRKMKLMTGNFCHQNLALSDSEAECIGKSKKRYMICRKCLCLVTGACGCKARRGSRQTEVTTASSDSNDHKQRNFTQGENDGSLSDSEVDRLSVPQHSFMQCRDCGSLTNAVCCEKRKRFLCKESGPKDGMGENGHGHSISTAGKQTLDNTEAMDCSPSEGRGNLSKNPVRYTGNLQQESTLEGLEDNAELDQETNIIPCIRAMVTSSLGVEVGTLFIVTCTGAVIGSSEQCDICIPEDGIHPTHARISYNKEQRHYFVTDLGSHTGTDLNSITVHKPGEETPIPLPVTHKSVLSLGSTMLVLHMHLGHETCNDCEPGQIQALLDKPINPVHIQTKAEKEATRRSELKNLKKKFHLHKDSYKQTTVPLGPKYSDRAAERRRTKGSDNPYEKDEMPTSYETELAAHNKGHQMLEKMGWSKGQGLGKSIKGITEPLVPKGTARGKSGLGFGQPWNG